MSGTAPAWELRTKATDSKTLRATQVVPRRSISRDSPAAKYPALPWWRADGIT
jgi:hypothetical protein